MTAYGRTMIEQTKQEVEKHYRIENGYDSDAKVIYGDTDSVMVNFKAGSLEKSMELGKEAAALVSEKFIKPIKLEFEKVDPCKYTYKQNNINYNILGLFSISSHQQKKICRSLLDKP